MNRPVHPENHTLLTPEQLREEWERARQTILERVDALSEADKEKLQKLFLGIPTVKDPIENCGPLNGLSKEGVLCFAICMAFNFGVIGIGAGLYATTSGPGAATTAGRIVFFGSLYSAVTLCFAGLGIVRKQDLIKELKEEIQEILPYNAAENRDFWQAIETMRNSVLTQSGNESAAEVFLEIFLDPLNPDLSEHIREQKQEFLEKTLALALGSLDLQHIEHRGEVHRPTSQSNSSAVAASPPPEALALGSVYPQTMADREEVLERLPENTGSVRAQTMADREELPRPRPKPQSKGNGSAVAAAPPAPPSHGK